MTNAVSLRDLVDALRSGKYTKGVGALQVKTEDQSSTFCCEGVMCEISGLKVVAWDEEDDETSRAYARYALPQGDATWSSFAPAYVWEGTPMHTGSANETAEVWLPVYQRDWRDDLVFNGWNYITLASLNDFNPRDPKNTFTFDQIADLIEWAYLSN